MTTLFAVLGWAHWAGLALIVVGYIMSAAAGVIHPIMVWGARLQFLLGLALVATMEMGGMTPNHMWVGVKLLVALVVVALCEIASAKARKGQNKPILMHLAAAFTAINTLYALFGR